MELVSKGLLIAAGEGLALQIPEGDPVCSKQPQEIGINGSLFPKRLRIPCRMIWPILGV